jgi:hypothetical protein
MRPEQCHRRQRPVLNAMAKLPRHEFVPVEVQPYARPLLIGFGLPAGSLPCLAQQGSPNGVAVNFPC